MKLYCEGFEIKFHRIAMIPKATHAAEHLEFAVRFVKRHDHGEYC